MNKPPKVFDCSFSSAIMGGPPSTGVEIPSESTGAAIREGAAAGFSCWGVSEMQAPEKAIFYKIQVTCVGARVMVKP